MIIIELSINNLRNHDSTRMNLNSGINVFYGMNGAGKTTVLEAASICAFSKTFLNTPDSSLVQKGKESFFVSAKAKTDIDTPYKINIKYTPGKRKNISSNLGDNLYPKDIIGEIPMVILSPDYKAITAGSPENRRNFIDRTISQSSKLYFENLVKLKRTLKQRNALLADAKNDYHFDIKLVQPWSSKFIELSADIILRRKNFIHRFIPIFKDIYDNISKGKEDTALKYEPDNLSPDNPLTKESIIDEYTDFTQKIFSEELRRGTTLFGPQKDDLKILINSSSAKDTASQGQHKTLLISIKFAEYEYLKENCNENPVILLDDIFSELDNNRASQVFNLIHENKAQSFITVTEPSLINKLMPKDSDYSFYLVKDGKVFNT